MKYTTFCGGINEDGARKSKKKSLYTFVDYIYKKCTLGSSGMPVLYIGCMVPKG
jgi:hypothetical protein